MPDGEPSTGMGPTARRLVADPSADEELVEREADRTLWSFRDQNGC